MYNGILASLYTAFVIHSVFSTDIVFFCIRSPMHSFLLVLAYNVGNNACLRPLYLKFNNQKKINFWGSVINFFIIK